MCGSERMERERERRKDARVCMFWKTSINSRSHHRWETQQTSSLVLRLNLQTVCLLAGMFSVHLSVMCILCLSLCMTGLAWHAHVSSCMSVFLFVFFLGGGFLCLMLNQLPILAPKETTSFFYLMQPAQEKRSSRASIPSLCLSSYPFLHNEEDQKLLT